MDCCLLIFDSEERILPQKSTVSVNRSDGRDVLLQRLGYSPTQFSLHVVPNSSLWAGSQLSPAPHNAPSHKQFGTILFEGSRDYSLVLVANGEEKDIVEPSGEVLITKDVKRSTPEVDSNTCNIHNVNESGYLTYNSNSTTPSNDVSMTSSPRRPNDCAAQDDSLCTIISDTEDELEDPLSDVNTSKFARPCVLPGIFSPRICPRLREEGVLDLSTYPFRMPAEKLSSKFGNNRHSNTAKNTFCNRLQHKQRPLKDGVVVISSSDEATESTASRVLGHTSKVSSHINTPLSSDEGIALECLCEESNNSPYESGVFESSVGHSFSDKSYKNERLISSWLQTAEEASVIKCCGFELTQADLKTLQPHQWLNDQVINCYMKLLMVSCGHQSKVHIMSTFFYTKLTRSGYTGVESWIKKIDLKKLRLLLVPVHLSMSHWALAAVNFKARSITYFDSLQIKSPTCLKRLKVFLLKCAKARKCHRVQRWRLCYAKGIPRQQNGDDCGVFVCQFAKWLCSRCTLKGCSKSHSSIPFQQRDIPGIRRTMLDELRTGICRLF